MRRICFRENLGMMAAKPQPQDSDTLRRMQMAWRTRKTLASYSRADDPGEMVLDLVVTAAVFMANTPEDKALEAFRGVLRWVRGEDTEEPGPPPMMQ